MSIGGARSPLAGPGPLVCYQNVYLLVLRLLFFEKFAGGLYGQKHKYGMGTPHRASEDKKHI